MNALEMIDRCARHQNVEAPSYQGPRRFQGAHEVVPEWQPDPQAGSHEMLPEPEVGHEEIAY